MVISRKSNKGIATATMIIIAFTAALILTSFNAEPVYADHTAVVTISPDIANCNELGNTFTVNVDNSAGSDEILQVEIYKALTGISDFTCGPAPNGWTLFSFTDRCIYVTELDSADKIAQGENLDFTFDATMSPESCQSEFVVVTVDDATPQGDRDTNNVAVNIDCTDPVIEKTVGDPKVKCTELQSCDYWITDQTPIGFHVRDNTDKCDLGVAYCDVTVTLDGEVIITERHENGYTLDFDLQFGEDSNHHIRVECVDEAGNVAILTEWDKVDSTPPETTKKIYGPLKEEDGVEYIDSESWIELTAVDPDHTGEQCAIEGVETWYYNELRQDEEPCWNHEVCERLGTTPPDVVFLPYSADEKIKKIDESCHVLYYYSVDELGNTEEMQTNCFFVDVTPPEVHKDNGNAIPDEGEQAFTNEGNPTGAFHWLTTDMPVTFSCDDSWDGVAPHPSGDEHLCYKVSYDYVQDPTGEYGWGYITDDYCATELTQDGYCCVDATVGIPLEFYFKEESMHNLEYYCVDAVEKESGIHIQYYKVDDTPPSITKTMIGEDHLGYRNDILNEEACPPVDENDKCYVRNYGENGVRIDVADGGAICAVDDVTCNYELWWETDLNTCIDEFDGTHLYNEQTGECFVEGGGFDESGVDILFHQDSTHTLTVNCEDELGNKMEEDVEEFLVDSTPPVTTKRLGPEGTFYIEDFENRFTEWIDTDTLITLEAEDNKVGVDATYYRVTPADNEFCWNYFETGENNCGDWHPSIPEAEGWILYETPFNGIPESCHVVEYYSVDNLSNTEDVKWQCIFVDKTEPMVFKTNPEGVIPGTGELLFMTSENPEGDFHYIDVGMPIELSCIDQDPHPSGNKYLYFRISFHYPDPDFVITEAYCNKFGGTYVEGNWCEVSLADEEIYEFFFMEQSEHNLEAFCVDNVGKESEVHVQYYKVDDTPPITEKIISEPFYRIPNPECVEDCEGGILLCILCPIIEYIDTATEITLESVDPPLHPVGVDKIWYANVMAMEMGDKSEMSCWVPEELCGEWSLPSPYNEKTGCINEAQDWCDENWQTEQYDNWESCVEDVAHNVCEIDERWHLYDGTPISKDEQSCHVFQYFAVDNLNNVEDMKFNCFFVDKTPPIIEKWYEGPYYNICEEPVEGTDTVSACVEWVTTETEVHAGAEDPLPHPSGVAEISYRVTLVDDANCWFDELCQDATGEDDFLPLPEDGTFFIDDESCHLIEILAKDNVDKTSLHKQCAFVDDTGPNPIKTVGEVRSKIDHTVNMDDYEFVFYPEVNGLCFNQSNENAIDCWKVTTLTPITLGCEDPSPHPVDHNVLRFVVDFDGEDVTETYCREFGGEYIEGECIVEEGTTIFFREESEHNLKFYCEDALGNFGPVDDEKFKVEGTQFEIEINKKWNLVSVPFVLQDESLTEVFEDVADKIEAVWTYDAAADEWHIFTPDGVANDDITRMLPGWGYWILANDTTTLVIGGSLFSPGITPPSKDIVAGWNLIGYYGNTNEPTDDETETFEIYDGPDGDGAEATCALGTLIDTTLGYPKWSTLVTYWEPDNPPNPWHFLDFEDNMDPGAGYWLEIDVDELYSPSTTCPIIFSE